MKKKPTRKQLELALGQAAEAHHQYQIDYLDGVHDQAWAGWYAAYLLGQLGGFTDPAQLTRWLEAVEADENWIVQAAKFILQQINQA
ncbi:MAG: hypothetical protein U5K99_10260 [Anaerolineales bacterium]|nr:hypothetical protein [Anaerolineales bacterium]